MSAPPTIPPPEPRDAYGVQDLYALSPFRTMSLRTGVTLFVLALGFLLSNAEGCALRPNAKQLGQAA